MPSKVCFFWEPSFFSFFPILPTFVFLVPVTLFFFFVIEQNVERGMVEGTNGRFSVGSFVHFCGCTHMGAVRYVRSLFQFVFYGRLTIGQSVFDVFVVIRNSQWTFIRRGRSGP